MDLKSLIKRTDGYKKNFGKSSTTKVVEHIPCVYSMPTIWTCDDVYTRADGMKKFCKSLREHEMKITNFGKIKKNLLNFPKKRFTSILTIKTCKVRHYCHYAGKYRGIAHSICDLQ